MPAAIPSDAAILMGGGDRMDGGDPMGRFCSEDIHAIYNYNIIKYTEI